MEEYKVIGVMSGTSLDGLDLAYCIIRYSDRWHYEIVKATTVPYSEQWTSLLSRVTELSAEELLIADVEYSRWLGQQVADFIAKNELSPDLVASHGHTVFHVPQNGLTFQLGNGQLISEISSIKTVSDFRSLDVFLGGQGAPLVPIGDQLLFAKYAACINIGGIANISFDEDGNRQAFDIGPANMILNRLSAELGRQYDEDGESARSGKLNTALLNELNNLEFYSQAHPKSLGYEWVRDFVFPILDSSTISIYDRLATATEHVAIQIAKVLDGSGMNEVLVTGGGGHNSFLIERMAFHIGEKPALIVPDPTLLEFKEALVFAFLGVLRLRGEDNCLASATGATRDCSGGVIYEGGNEI